MNKKNLALKVGTAGELRVASELLIRGFCPAKPCLDEGIDLMLGNGNKIQVKSAHKVSSIRVGSSSKRYNFSLFTGTYMAENGKRKKVPMTFEKVDFVIFWLINDDNFCIVPAFELKDRRNIHFSSFTRKEGMYKKYLNNWDILKR